MTTSRIPEATITEHLRDFRTANQLGYDHDYDNLLQWSIQNHINDKFIAKKGSTDQTPLDRYIRAMAKKHKILPYLDMESAQPDQINPAIIRIMLNNLFESLRTRMSRFQNLGHDNQFNAEQKEKARLARLQEIDRQLDVEFASATLDKDDGQTTAHINKVLSKTKITVRKPTAGSSLDAATITGTAGGAIDNVTTLLGRAARIAGLIADAVGTASSTMLETIESVRSINMFVGLAAAFLYFFTTPVKLAITAYQRYKKRKIVDDLINQQTQIDESNRLNGTNNKMNKADRQKLKALQYEIKNQGSLFTLRGGARWAISGVFLAVSVAAAFAFTAAFAAFFTMAFPLVATMGGSFGLGEHIHDYRANKTALAATIANIESTKEKLERIKNDMTTAATALTDALNQPVRNQRQIEKLKEQITDYKTAFKTTSNELRDLHVTKHHQHVTNIRLTTNFAKAKSTIGIIIPIISIIGSALTLTPPTFFIGVGILVFAGAVLLTMFALQLIHTRQMNKKIAAMAPAEETISLTEDLSTDARLHNAFAAAPIQAAQVADAIHAAQVVSASQGRGRGRLTEITAIPKPGMQSGKEEMVSDDKFESSKETTTLLGDDGERPHRSTKVVY